MFIGGGLVTLTVVLLLLVVLGYHSIRVLRSTRNGTAFAISGLLFYVLIMGSMGETIDTSPFGFTFWILVSVLPTVASRLSAYTAQQAATELSPMKWAHSD